MKICTEKNKPKTTTKDYILVAEDASCEHCGSLEPFDPILVSSTRWCLPCALAGPDFTISDLDAEKIFKLVIEEKKNYYLSEIRYLSTLEINDIVPV